MSRVDIEIVTKNCYGCGIEFRVMKGSSQKYHSRQCELLGRKWDGRKSQSKPEKRRLEIAIAGESKMNPDFEKEKKSVSFGGGFPVLQERKKKLTQEKESGTQKIDKKISTENVIGEKEIQKKPESTIGSIMQKTGTNSESKSKTVSIVETPQLGLQKQSIDLIGATSASMNILDSTQNELRDLMISLKRENDKSPEMDVGRVRAATECGKQIISAMRMKLDILKFAKEINEDGTK